MQDMAIHGSDSVKAQDLRREPSRYSGASAPGYHVVSSSHSLLGWSRSHEGRCSALTATLREQQQPFRSLALLTLVLGALRMPSSSMPNA